MLSRGRPPGRPPGLLRTKPVCHPTLGVAFAVQTLPTASISVLGARRWWPAGSLPPRCSPRTVSTFSPPIFPTWTSMTTTAPTTSLAPTSISSSPMTSIPPPAPSSMTYSSALVESNRTCTSPLSSSPRTTRRVTFEDPPVSSCLPASEKILQFEKRLVTMENTVVAALKCLDTMASNFNSTTSTVIEKTKSLDSSINTLEMRIAATEGFDKVLDVMTSNFTSTVSTVTEKILEFDERLVAMEKVALDPSIPDGYDENEDSDNDDSRSIAAESDDEVVYWSFKRDYLQREGPEALANLSEDQCKKEMALWKRKIDKQNLADDEKPLEDFEFAELCRQLSNLTLKKYSFTGSAIEAEKKDSSTGIDDKCSIEQRIYCAQEAASFRPSHQPFNQSPFFKMEAK